MFTPEKYTNRYIDLMPRLPCYWFCTKSLLLHHADVVFFMIVCLIVLVIKCLNCLTIKHFRFVIVKK
jgi:hypothetical protein